MSSESLFKWRDVIKIEDETNNLIATAEIIEPPSKGNIITSFFKKVKPLVPSDINKVNIEIKQIKGEKEILVSKGL